ncbi:hypothetical protein [Hyalangium rubrum]|uniref:Uncharacterized protein n=1 Tax=Hyalangium rubrum TaxID=3103134 RepID=A0ABU5H3X6_9BACT|nr:hypothetical protein [Hyalangium sp. s54d21]MDY7228170.1 hypothetical protein [Hyalangium sp. s54d21]
MSRIVLGVGGTGLLVAGVLALWLRQPVELPADDEFTTESFTTEPRREFSSSPVVVRTPPPLEARPASPPPASLRSAPVAPPEPLPREEEVTQATRLRSRIVLALRGQHPTPLARRDAVLSEFLSSGVSQEPWTQEARAALEHWREQIAASVLPVRAEPSVCYAAGCLERVTFPDPESFAEAQRRVPQLALGSVGPHMQLPPEHLPSGEVVVSWAVLRPEPL